MPPLRPSPSPQQKQQQQWLDVLELGCGRGDSGGEFRGLANRLTGVDVSSLALAAAARKAATSPWAILQTTPLASSNDDERQQVATNIKAEVVSKNAKGKGVATTTTGGGGGLSSGGMAVLNASWVRVLVNEGAVEERAMDAVLGTLHAHNENNSGGGGSSDGTTAGTDTGSGGGGDGRKRRRRRSGVGASAARAVTAALPRGCC